MDKRTEELTTLEQLTELVAGLAPEQLAIARRVEALTAAEKKAVLAWIEEQDIGGARRA